MSALGEAARLTILLADVAVADAINKVNIIGAAFQGVSIDPQTGNTSAMSLVVMVDVSPDHHDQTYVLEAALYDETANDELVSVPGPTGELTPVRIGSTILAERPTITGQQVPPNTLWAHAQLIVNFPTGLRLAPGHFYRWQARIDGDDENAAAVSFLVLGGIAPPVIG